MARERGEGRPDGLEDRVVKIRRCAAVVKAGRRFSFNALVVVGDNKGRVAAGYGKANEVPQAVDKATKDAEQALRRQRRIGLKAGAGVRDVLEVCGIRNILTKVHGSSNPINLVKATIQGLLELRTREEVARLRGLIWKDSHGPFDRTPGRPQAEG